jgi:2'-phosphotransferase
MSKKQIKLSKTLSSILRHGILDNGLVCDERGFVKVSDLTAKGLIACAIDELQAVVDSSEKKRFTMETRDGAYFIKANQGHSAAVGALLGDEVCLEPVLEPLPFCAHGTQKRFMESINERGLNRMKRKHIHFVSEVRRDEQVSGFKAASNTIIVINMQECMKDGMKFYKSANGVILTEGLDGVVDSKYFLDILDI